MMGLKERAFAPLCNRSIEDLVPADNFYRHLDAKLDLSFVREWVAELYAGGGRPSVDPVVFFKLQLVMFFEGVRSERKLMEVATDRLSLRWYLGYDLDEPLPDHSSLTRIRERYGLAIFERFFERVVELCQEAGLVWGEELLFDATKVRANADVDSLVPRFYWKAKRHLGETFADGAAESAWAKPPAPAADEPAPLPVSLPAGRAEELAAENGGRWRLLDERRLDPDRPPVGRYQRVSDLRVSTTDPDAAPMRLKGEGTRLGYHDHYAVDGGKARVILAALVTPADVMENAPMRDLLWRARFRWKLRPRRAVGDTTYGTGENIRALEDAGIRAYVPLPDWGLRTRFYGAGRFTYDRERDEYRCPQGRPLRRSKAKADQHGVQYRAEAAACNACPAKAECTDSENGRTVLRPFLAEYLDLVRTYHETPAYKKAMRKREVWVEPLFGEAKDWHGLRRFRLRGLDNVNIEALMVAAGQNLKRLLKRWGWGRRPWPTGGTGWPSPAPFPAPSSPN
jgi:transposase